MRLTTLLVPLCLTLAVASCSKKGEKDEPEGVADPAPAPAPEPEAAQPVPEAVEASPSVYQLIAENDGARMLLATWKPAEKDALHSHPESVFYVLAPGKVAAHTPDGSRAEIDAAAGMSGAQPVVAGHQLENLSDTDVEMLLVERKAGEAKLAPEGADPGAEQVSPDIYEVVLDKEWVRVLKGTWKPGVTDKPHSHPDMLAYILTDGKIKLIPAEGEPKEMDVKAGAAIPAGALASHTLQNTGDAEMSMLLFELK